VIRDHEWVEGMVFGQEEVRVAEREEEEGFQSGWWGVEVVCSTCFYEDLHYQIHAHRWLLMHRAGYLERERESGKWEIEWMWVCEA
jgi:hypothetical protein